VGKIPPDDSNVPVFIEQAEPTAPSVNDVLAPTIVPPPLVPAASAAFVDPASLSSQIERALSAIPADKLGCFLVHADLQKASIAVMVRAGGSVSFLARVQKTYTGGLDAEVGGRITFLLGEAEAAPAPPATLTLSDYYEVFRNVGTDFTRNSRFRASVKAVGIRVFNLRPYLDGKKWWHVS
jgi:hypothetical protein